jgi:hypothetical protein
MEIEMRDYSLHNAQQTEQLSGHGILVQVWKNWKARRDVMKFQKINDHLLRDIGSSRSDIVCVVLAPLSRNAIAMLQERRNVCPSS